MTKSQADQIIVKYHERQVVHTEPSKDVAASSSIQNVLKERVFDMADKAKAIEFIQTHSMGNASGYDSKGNYRPTVHEVVGLDPKEYAPKGAPKVAPAPVAADANGGAPAAPAAKPKRVRKAKAGSTPPASA